MTFYESLAHIAAAAGLSAGMIGVGFGALGAVRRGMSQVRPIWLLAGAGGGAFTLSVANAELRWNGLGGSTLFWVGSAILVGGIVGGLLLSRGLRGRYVGDHEHCRRCGFDLFGRPADARVCNECGSPLDAPRAIVIGVRHRRPVALVSGAFLVVACVAIAASAGRAALAGGGQLNLTSYKPTAWLRRDARVNDRDGYDAAREILRRLAAGSLSDDEIRSIAAEATQGTGRSFSESYLLSVAEAGWERGLIDEATIRAVVRKQLLLSLYVVPQTPEPTRLSYAIAPAGTLAARWPPPAGWTFAAGDRADRIDGRTLSPDAVERSAISEVGWGGRSMTVALGNLYRLDGVALPADRPLEVTITMTLSVTYAAASRPPIVETTAVTLRGGTRIGAVDDADRVPMLADGDADPQLDATASAFVNPAVDGWTTIDLTTGVPGRAFVGDAFAVDADGRDTRLGETLIQNGRGKLIARSERVPAAGAFAIVLRPFTLRPQEATSLPPAVYAHPIRIDASRVTRLGQ